MKKVAVIGGGITGIQASLDLIRHGVEVHLIEKGSFIGGHVPQLDKIFPTGDGSRCIISSKINEVFKSPNLHLHTMTNVCELAGNSGDFTLKLIKSPRYVDSQKCDGCLKCSDVCPVEVYNEFDAGIGVRKAIYISYNQAVPGVAVRDAVHCIDCRMCFNTCPNDAVLENFEDLDTEFEISNICSVIVCTGYSMYNPAKESRYRYLKYPDVITSLEFERMLDPDGPTKGEIRRLSDGMVPKSILFIQCVGSRNSSIGRNYCSGVCCMYTIKNANAVKEKYGDSVNVTILKSDTRAFGKGYQEYNHRIKKTHKIQVYRCMAGSIECGDKNRLRISIEKVKKGETSVTPIVNLEPELVVLSASLSPSEGSGKIAKIFGITTSPDSGFFTNSNDCITNPVGTQNPGIYIAGSAAAPRDINDCINQGEACAMKAFLDVMHDSHKE